MSIELANHNDDIRRLVDRGYAVRIDGSYLVVRDIPYLDGHKAPQWGAFVAKLEYIDKVRVKQDDHQIYFAGAFPSAWTVNHRQSRRRTQIDSADQGRRRRGAVLLEQTGRRLCGLF